jgi:hypothetical protein
VVPLLSRHASIRFDLQLDLTDAKPKFYQPRGLLNGMSAIDAGGVEQREAVPEQRTSSPR